MRVFNSARSALASVMSVSSGRLSERRPCTAASDLQIRFVLHVKFQTPRSGIGAVVGPLVRSRHRTQASCAPRVMGVTSSEVQLAKPANASVAYSLKNADCAIDAQKAWWAAFGVAFNGLHTH